MVIMKAKALGFTLIELLISVTVAGVLLVMGGPQLSEFNDNRKLRAAVREFQATIQFARTEAITRNANVSFETLITTDTDNWSDDFQICEVANTGDSCTASAVEIIKTFNIGKSLISINSNSNGDTIISFNSKGRLDEGVSNTVDLAFCDGRSDGDHKYMTISVTGRPTYVDLDTTAGHSCDP